jgi:hypothetical protein
MRISRGFFPTIVAAATAAVWAACPQGFLGREHDDALYVLAAQSVAQGHYRWWFLPGRPPILQTTPGWPALLATVAAAGPDAFWAYQQTAALFLAACVPLLWWWSRRRWPEPVALALTLLFALNPLVLSRSGIVMPEGPFLFATLLVLLSFERSGLLLGGELLAAYLIRPAAIPLWMALWIALAWRKRWRDLAWAAAIPLGGFALWWMWSRAGGGVQETNELRALYTGATPAMVWTNALTNFATFLRTLGQTLLPLPWARTGWALVPGIALVGWAAGGTIAALRRRPWEASNLFLPFSLGMDLLWPWWYDRYWVPLLAFLWAAALQAVPRPWIEGKSKKVAAVLMVPALAAFLGQGLFLYRADSGNLSPELAATYAWIQTHTGPGDRFASAFYGTDLLHTARLFQPLPVQTDAAAFARELDRRGIRFVLWKKRLDLGFTREGNGTLRALRETEGWLKDPALFRPRTESPSGEIALYERV